MEIRDGGIFLTAEDAVNLSYPLFTGVMDDQDGKTVAVYTDEEREALKTLSNLVDNL